ncbi:uncharacterized protein LOC118537517 isoform X1 [Halichoerus grypus]|uniref:uncharacterized protein LOC118537517 isoform X1 n=1 Tax=Halichoerus grypus TaxID=9711 RepID=UPI0016594A00|nr:uncharacterized protein LOC118537517 isoform X1 [Halichoerus grypus]XP_035950871.1 uncharacterized protein LOC118537517 isoform X1 [Halichoerus grypus]XP_035950873.1 uncharacterized protein LOC118537517 isoform X1 [Halichoerus grypus]XP_035950874.1 uncharacterized protein LOC118537517 isoform X1 [Halichoerus grypus]XP_035950875.1 uncharacterized protein LOC118537517 isoform X1 [Halichoerus grypus]XP_035950876.1 uncharacterized protein LOC118537517 isoform X1 [Halichoerus grypus]
MKEKDKEGANEEEEKEDRHRVNYRWTQKTQVTAIRRQRGQPSEKEDGQDAGLGPEKAWGVGRVPVWPLWTILLLVRPLGGLGSPLCPQEPFYFLVAIMKMLGNKNDGTLYTPDDLSVCPAETLGCFRLELSVIQFEEGPSLGIAVFRLQRLLDALGSRLWARGLHVQPKEPRGRGEKEENKIRSLKSLTSWGGGVDKLAPICPYSPSQTLPPLSSSRKGQSMAQVSSN